jgi:hypothetical protein
LSLCLVSSELGCFDSQTVRFGLQRSVFGCEVIHLGLQQRFIGSSLSSNLWLPQRQANKQSKKFFRAKNLGQAKEKALTANVIQRSRQTLVLLLQRKEVLVYFGEIFDNRLYQGQRESASRLWVRGQAQV